MADGPPLFAPPPPPPADSDGDGDGDDDGPPMGFAAPPAPLFAPPPPPPESDSGSGSDSEEFDEDAFNDAGTIGPPPSMAAPPPVDDIGPPPAENAPSMLAANAGPPPVLSPPTPPQPTLTLSGGGGDGAGGGLGAPPKIEAPATPSSAAGLGVMLGAPPSEPAPAAAAADNSGFLSSLNAKLGSPPTGAPGLLKPARAAELVPAGETLPLDEPPLERWGADPSFGSPAAAIAAAIANHAGPPTSKPPDALDEVAAVRSPMQFSLANQRFDRLKMFDGATALMCMVNIMRIDGSLGIQLAGGAPESAAGLPAESDDSIAALRRRSGAVFVKVVRPNGAVDQAGALRVGDQIIEVNGVSTAGLSHSKVVEMFVTGGDMLSIKFARAAVRAIPDVMVRGKTKKLKSPKKAGASTRKSVQFDDNGGRDGRPILATVRKDAAGALGISINSFDAGKGPGGTYVIGAAASGPTATGLSSAGLSLDDGLRIKAINGTVLLDARKDACFAELKAASTLVFEFKKDKEGYQRLIEAVAAAETANVGKNSADDAAGAILGGGPAAAAVIRGDGGGDDTNVGADNRFSMVTMERLLAMVDDGETGDVSAAVAAEHSDLRGQARWDHDESSSSDEDEGVDQARSSIARTASVSSFSSVAEVERLNGRDQTAGSAAGGGIEIVQMISSRRCGWMQKRGGGTKLVGRKSWKKRFFVLQDSMLFYYKPDVVLPDDSGVIPGSTAAGYINLASQCKVSQPSKNRICLQAELRNYFFICESSEEAAAWEADISKNLAIVKKSEHVT